MSNEGVVFRVINGITRPIKEFKVEDKPIYTIQADIFREMNIGSSDFHEAKNYLLREGRGLGAKLDEELSDEEKYILDIIDKEAVECPYNIMAYRTDDTAWLNKYKPGEDIPINNLLFCTLDKDIVIPENTNKVLQRMTIQIPKGTKVFGVGNGNEMELDIVRHQFLRMVDHDMQGTTYSYTVKVKDED